MKLLAPFALLACLAACSSRAPADGATADGAAGANEVAVSPNAPDSHATPKPAEMRTFGDWTVACDNGGQCSMASLAPEDGDFYAINLALTRDAGPEGALSVALWPNEEGVTPAMLAVDDVRVGGRFPALVEGRTTLSGTDAVAAAFALANGRALTVRDPAGAVLETLSLTGASAALRYIDARQGRAGTASAIVAKGNAPAVGVPAPAPLPLIVARPMPAGEAEVAPALLATIRAQAGCDDELVADIPPETHRLDDKTTLVLMPCSRGAYNLSSAVFTVTDDAPAPARMDAPSGFTEDGEAAAVPQVVNASVENGVLSSYAKGRGLGDCGVEQDFVWDGTTFRLAQQAEMGECRGNANLLTTWRTSVVRR